MVVGLSAVIGTLLDPSLPFLVRSLARSFPAGCEEEPRAERKQQERYKPKSAEEYGHQ